jgi:hypothetical protein
MIQLKTLKQTCMACPSQWEAETEEGSPIYIRYRWGYLSVRVGKIGQEIVTDYEEILGVQFGELLDGHLTTNNMINILRHNKII